MGAEASVGALSVAIEGPVEQIESGSLSGLRRVAGGLASAIIEAAAHERANQISHTLQESLLPPALAVGSWFDLAAQPETCCGHPPATFHHLSPTRTVRLSCSKPSSPPRWVPVTPQPCQ